jgi:hypothetical protein
MRIVFWVVGLISGGLVAFTTRHYVNGDALAYFDMAEAFRRSLWSDVVNLTYAPGYSLLLAGLQYLYPCDATYELFQSKILNYLCFILAMGSCDVLLGHIRREVDSNGSKIDQLSFPAFEALCYSAFLLVSITWIRLEIVTPDLLVFALVLLTAVSLIKIRRNPHSYFSFAVLGLVMGGGYIVKTFFFPFSLIPLSLAGLCCSSWKRAISRVAVAIIAMLLVCSPMILSQSRVAGKVSFGEAGNYNYGHFVAGKGQAIHVPEKIHGAADLLVYDRGLVNTYPHGNDPAYWSLGVHPVFDLKAQLSAVWINLQYMAGRMFYPTIIIILWFVAQVFSTPVSISKFNIAPPCVSLMLLAMAIAGISMYTLIVMEERYVAPFVFLGLMGLFAFPKRDFGCRPSQTGTLKYLVFVVFIILGSVILTIADQSQRSLVDTTGKPSHRQTFTEFVAMKEYFHRNGIHKGDMVAIIVPFEGRLYWARMSGVRLVGEIVDAQKFLAGTATSRQDTLRSIGNSRMRAVVGKGVSFADLINEGWEKVPETTDYFIYRF